MERKIDRLDKYMEYKGLNDNKITVLCSLSVGVLGKSRKTGRDLSDKVIEVILNKFQDLNRIWLLTGDGKMINPETTNILPPIEKEKLIEFGSEIFKNKLLDLFQKGEIFPASVMTEKENKISELNREIGRLEARIKELEKDNGNS